MPKENNKKSRVNKYKKRYNPISTAAENEEDVTITPSVCNSKKSKRLEKRRRLLDKIHHSSTSTTPSSAAATAEEKMDGLLCIGELQKTVDAIQDGMLLLKEEDTTATSSSTNHHHHHHQMKKKNTCRNRLNIFVKEKNHLKMVYKHPLFNFKNIREHVENTAKYF